MDQSNLEQLYNPEACLYLMVGNEEKLLTKDRLHDPLIDQTCLLCRAEVETAKHLFFQCSFVQQIWNSIKGWLGFRRALSTLKADVKWAFKEAKGIGIQPKAKRLGIACTTYYLWEVRNLRAFEGKVQAPEEVIRKIQVVVYCLIHHIYQIFLVYEL